MQTHNSYVYNNNKATIICPVCSKAKIISVANFKHKKHILNGRCSCNTIFKVHLNFRHHLRKSVILPGTYQTFHQYQPSKGSMHVVDISQGGLRYNVDGVNQMETGFILMVGFNSNAKPEKSVRKLAIVRSVNKDFVGCEFFDRKSLDTALTF